MKSTSASRRGSAEPSDVYSITGVRRSALDDQRSRRNRYLWSMGVRTLCFGLAVVSTGPLRWVFIAGAILLPYIAVVLANAGRERMGPEPEAPTSPPMVAIEQSAPYDDGVLYPGPANWSQGPPDGTNAAGH